MFSSRRTDVTPTWSCPLPLCFQLAIHDQELQEFPAAHQGHTITATRLVPLPEPKHGTNFFRGEAALGKPLPFSDSCICVGSHLTLFVNRFLYIHLAILLLEWGTFFALQTPQGVRLVQ